MMQKKCFSAKVQKHSWIIPNPMSERIPLPYKGAERKNKIVAVGRLEEEKNHMLLLDAFQCFAKEYPEYELIIYGSGVLLPQLENKAELLGISDKVVFAGFVKGVLEEIADAKMYVLSSDYEGMSNSLLEAMGIGMPVISTDCPIGGSAMLIEDGENGLLVPVGNVMALSNAMKQIVANPELTEKLSKNAARCREKYSVDKICEQWLEVLNYSVTSEKRKRNE